MGGNAPNIIPPITPRLQALKPQGVRYPPDTDHRAHCVNDNKVRAMNDAVAGSVNPHDRCGGVRGEYATSDKLHSGYDMSSSNRMDQTPYGD